MTQPQLVLTEEEVKRREETTKINQLQQEHGGMCKDFKLSGVYGICENLMICQLDREIDTGVFICCDSVGRIKIGRRKWLILKNAKIAKKNKTNKKYWYMYKGVLIGCIFVWMFLFIEIFANYQVLFSIISSVVFLILWFVHPFLWIFSFNRWGQKVVQLEYDNLTKETKSLLERYLN